VKCGRQVKQSEAFVRRTKANNLILFQIPRANQLICPFFIPQMKRKNALAVLYLQKLTNT